MHRHSWGDFHSVITGNDPVGNVTYEARSGGQQAPRPAPLDAPPPHNLTPEQLARLMNYLASHPALELIYRFKQRLCSLLLKKNRTRRQCELLAARFLKAVHQLRQAGLPQLVQLGQTLFAWRSEIACMWRFSRSNGITEGFHTKMELINRQAYGFRNFNNYRMRVKVLCA
jgi:transposase